MVTTKQKNPDYDTPWRQILQQNFQDAITFFFPDIAPLIDWTQPPKFLDKEFSQIAPDAKTGRRFADQLVQVKRKRGKDLILILHIEVQSAPEKNFAERMFIYAIRIFDFFRQPAISLAILCDARPTWRPNTYHFEFPHTKLNFEFGIVKLLDYRDRPELLENTRNPFATVVKAHLKLQETKKDLVSRKAWKLQLIRDLYESGYNQDQIINLFRFIDWVLILPKPLETEFWSDLKAYEEERQMPYITSVERIGYDRGRKEGQEERSRAIARNMLNEGASLDFIIKVTGLPLEQIQNLQSETSQND